MTFTIGTSNLVDIVTDALQTSGEFGIHFATHRAADGDEPGETDLVAVTSSTGWVIGHTWAPIDGQAMPCVWPVEAAKNVLAVCKNLASARGKDHTVDIEVVEVRLPADVDDDEHPGALVTLRETPALFDSDTELQFHADGQGKFPLAASYRTLSGAVGDKAIDTAELLWSPGILGAVTAVAKRRKSPMRFFRDDRRKAHLVQIGDRWLGAAVPLTIPPGDTMRGPSIDPLIVVPDSAATELAEHLAKMKADGITVTVDRPRGAVGKAIDLATASGVLLEPTLPGTEPTKADAEADMLRQAVELVVTTQFGSCAMLQRKLTIGYGRAMRYVNRMIAAGIMADGDKPTAARQVLVTDLPTAFALLANSKEN